MTRALIFDFSRVLLFPKDKNYAGGLNSRHDELTRIADYRFLEHFEFNETLLSTLENFKAKYGLYVFTTGHIQETPEVKKRISGIFRGVISVEQIPHDKKDPKGYLYVVEQLGLTPGEVIYIDDTIQNIEVAKGAGLEVIHFQNNEQLLSDLKARNIL